ncbi:MAG: hypothetical protein M1834_007767 [Cirrosporium novae-zelandiae]|nr:MAG: hypothetical protein M1834_007767 [Cirrosporium novae-zelandiae]
MALNTSAQTLAPLIRSNPQSTLLPFLYQTATLRKIDSAAIRRIQMHLQLIPSSRRKYATNRPSGTSRGPAEYIPFEGLSKGSTSQLGAPQIPRSKNSTITKQERDIWAQVFKGLAKYPAPGPKTSRLRNSVADVKRDETQSESPSVSMDPTSAENAHDMEENLRKAIDRYPPALRTAALNAMRSAALNWKEGGAEEEPELTEAEKKAEKEYARIIRETRERELRRIIKCLEDQKTDVGIWKVLEQEVFSMLEKLGLSELKSRSTPAHPIKKTFKKAESAPPKKPTPPVKTAQESSSEAETTPSTGIIIPPLAIVAPTYSGTVLHAIRLLHERFPSSPLALNLLPHLKSLGRTSYVLGATTPFYNELLTLNWRVYGDLHSMLSLLKEMDDSGVEFNDHTGEILDAVARDCKSDQMADPGLMMQWWESGEVEKAMHKLMKWRNTIRRRAMEREIEQGETEVEMGAENYGTAV